MYSHPPVSYYDMERLAHVAGLDTHIGSVFRKRIFTVASHLIMCLWDALTAVDAPLFVLFV